LAKPSFDWGGSAAMLLPSNDTRVNLYLLLADRRGAPMLDPAAKSEGLPLALFPWKVMAARTPPPRVNDDAGYGSLEGSRCDTITASAASFAAAVRSAPRVPETERQALIATRDRFGSRSASEQTSDNWCHVDVFDLSLVKSPVGREFASYLEAARTFYSGDLDLAAQRFTALRSTRDPWVRETSQYMIGRSLLNLALDRSMDQYGSLTADKRDAASAQASAAAFQEYLKTYSDGLYSSSARGLLRRAHWIGGDQEALAADYSAQIEGKSLDGAATDVDLVNEIDSKFPLPTSTPRAVHDPILLAVVDLHRMRRQGDEYPGGPQIDRAVCCGPSISKAEINDQRALFGRDTELYDYVRAAEAYFVRHEPREVLELIPDASHQARFSYLQFSRQMLRGMALQDVRDRNARTFWLSLFPGAVQPYQGQALELALAMNDEKAGRLDLVFAPDSKVNHPIIRELLLERTAGPDILRQQATRPGVSKIEREVALYILLSKELRRGFYRQFLGDIRLLPRDATADTFFGGAPSYDAEINAEQSRPPLGRFGPSAALGSGCPALTHTAAQLAGKPRAARPRLCLAEFFRRNGFDDFEGWNSFDDPVQGNGLASSRSLFPAGTPYSRLEVYKQVMSDPAASADDIAWALNRAVRCYAPSGNNSCGGVEVGQSVRRAWFGRLQSRYPQSQWAKDLDYYW
jgi:hypothetical protein